MINVDSNIHILSVDCIYLLCAIPGNLLTNIFLSHIFLRSLIAFILLWLGWFSFSLSSAGFLLRLTAKSCTEKVQ